MDFRNKIKSYISKWWAKEWKTEVQNEKKQKYLFGWTHPNEQFKRSRKTPIFGKKNEKLSMFSNFFQEKIVTGNIFHDYGNIMSVIGLMLIFLTGYIIVFSPYFKISPNQVIVEASTPWIDIAIAYRVLESTYGESIFLIDEADIAKKLKAQLKNIASISINSLYPNGIKVLITGAPTIFDTSITGIPDKKWWLSKNWVLVPSWDLWDIKIQYHINITSWDFIGDFFLNYKQGISEYNMWIISHIFDLFTTEWPDLKLARSEYFSGENELHIILESGTKIIFALQNEADKQPGNIPKYILDQLITFRTYLTNNHDRVVDSSITYIDARIPWKIFICSDKIICQQNLILIYGEAYK